MNSFALSVAGKLSIMECLVECDSTAPHQLIPLLTFLSEDHLTKRSPDLKMVFKVIVLSPGPSLTQDSKWSLQGTDPSPDSLARLPK